MTFDEWWGTVEKDSHLLFGDDFKWVKNVSEKAFDAGFEEGKKLILTVQGAQDFHDAAIEEVDPARTNSDGFSIEKFRAKIKDKLAEVLYEEYEKTISGFK